MTQNNERDAFESWLLKIDQGDQEILEASELAQFAWQAAIQASESEINSLKQRVEELQADNLRLREALKSAWSYTHTNEKLMDNITSLLSSTPTQSLTKESK